MKLLEDWRLLTADHGGHVRLWNCRDLVGAGHTPCLTSHPAFAPSIDHPASGLIDLEVGAALPCLLPVGCCGCGLLSACCWLLLGLWAVSAAWCLGCSGLIDLQVGAGSYIACWVLLLLLLRTAG